PRWAHDPDRAAVLLDGPIRNGETQTHALPALLDGEERIEHPRLELRRNPGPGIGDRDVHRPGADRTRHANRLAWGVGYGIPRVRQRSEERRVGKECRSRWSRH